MRVEGFELRVEVDPAVHRVSKVGEAHASALIRAGGQDAQFVLGLESLEADAGALEGISRQRAAVQLDALNGGGEEVDEGLGAGLRAAELNSGIAAERLVAGGQIEGDSVGEGRGDEASSKASLIARQFTGSVLSEICTRRMLTDELVSIAGRVPR